MPFMIALSISDLASVICTLISAFIQLSEVVVNVSAVLNMPSLIWYPNKAPCQHTVLCQTEIRTPKPRQSDCPQLPHNYLGYTVIEERWSWLISEAFISLLPRHRYILHVSNKLIKKIFFFVKFRVMLKVQEEYICSCQGIQWSFSSRPFFRDSWN